MENICKRCGECCKVLAPYNMWEHNTHLSFMMPFPDGSYRERDKFRDQLIEVRKTYSIKDHNGCDMLIYEDGISYCLPHKLFGLDFKPDDCKNYKVGTDKVCNIKE